MEQKNIIYSFLDVSLSRNGPDWDAGHFSDSRTLPGNPGHLVSGHPSRHNALVVLFYKLKFSSHPLRDKFSIEISSNLKLKARQDPCKHLFIKIINCFSCGSINAYK